MQTSPRTTILFSLTQYLTDHEHIIDSRYVCVYFDKIRPSITSIAADFEGNSNYGTNILSTGGVVLETESLNGVVHASSDGAANGGVQVSILSNTSSFISISISNIVDYVLSPLVMEVWTLSLNDDSRACYLNIKG